MNGLKTRLIVDGVFFQLAQSGIARIWKTVLPKLVERHSIEAILLDRGGAPDLAGIRRIPFRPYSPSLTAQDSSLLEDICDLNSADMFLSTYYSTPLKTPALSVVYDMIPERLGWDLGEAIWQEKELHIRYGRRHLCISEQTRLDLLEFYPELDPQHVEVAYCGVDRSIFSPSSAADQQRFRIRLGLSRPFYILVGHRSAHEGYKNCRPFFEAVSKMNDSDFDILCVGGEVELEPWIFEYLPKTCRVTRVDLEDQDLAIAYTSAEALVYPSKYEGFGLPVIEAMACGCPVISTTGGAIPEAAGTAAYFVDPNSVSEMIAGLRAVRRPEIREKLKGEGNRQSAEFHWTTFVDAVARNVQQVNEGAKAGQFTEYYNRWSQFRLRQGNTDEQRAADA